MYRFDLLHFKSKSWWCHLVSSPRNFNCLSNLYGTNEMGDTLYSKTSSVFGIKDTRRFHNATVEKSARRFVFSLSFIEVVSLALVSLWPMQDSRVRQQTARRSVAHGVHFGGIRWPLHVSIQLSYKIVEPLW